MVRRGFCGLAMHCRRVAARTLSCVRKPPPPHPTPPLRPLLPFAGELPPGVHQVLENTAALFVNGFVFDELDAAAVLGAARRASAAGAAVFFDPGARVCASGAACARVSGLCASWEPQPV